MARARSIHASIAQCTKRARLSSDTHRMLYEWMTPHLDRDGRITADPRVFRAIVCPMLEHVGALECAAAIRDFVECDLAESYTDPLCRSVLVVPGFADSQRGMRYDREPPSEFGDPPRERAPDDEPPDEPHATDGALAE